MRRNDYTYNNFINLILTWNLKIYQYILGESAYMYNKMCLCRQVYINMNTVVYGYIVF